LGFGAHRCTGSQVAEMLLRMLWEEIMARFPLIKVVESPERLSLNFEMRFSKMMGLLK